MNLRVDDQSPVPFRSSIQRSDEAEFLAALKTATSAQTISSSAEAAGPVGPEYTSSASNEAGGPVSALSGLVFMAKRGRPWMKVQDAAREQGIHLSKEEAIRLAQQLGQQEADRTRDQTKDQTEQGEEAEGQKSDFSIAATARAVENRFFEPIAHGAGRLFESAKNSLTSTVHAIIPSNALAGRTVAAN